jgi:hypothetical protein
MVKSGELRVGNWVQDEHNHIQYVYRIWQNGVELSDDATGSGDLDYEDKELFGIPLSIEMLKKNGYKNTEGWADDLYSIKHYTVMARFNKFQINGIRYDVKYVHQLQNIHFILTGEELQVDI